MSLESKTKLVFIALLNTARQSNGLTFRRYNEEMLEEHVVSFSRFIGKNVMFVHDNARPLTAAVVWQYFEVVNMSVMPLPARNLVPNAFGTYRTDRENEYESQTL